MERKANQVYNVVCRRGMDSLVIWELGDTGYMGQARVAELDRVFRPI